MNMDRIEAIQRELKDDLNTLATIDHKLKEAIKYYVGEFDLKGNEVVGWLGEMYSCHFFDGEIQPDVISYDILIPGKVEERLEVKTRRVSKSGKDHGTQSGVIKLTGREQEDPTSLVFVTLTRDYLLQSIYKFPLSEIFGGLDNIKRLRSSKVKKNFRGYTLTLREDDKQYLVYPEVGTFWKGDEQINR